MRQDAGTPKGFGEGGGLPSGAKWDYKPVMRHSGRVLRPPGQYPAGLMPDLWGFGSSHELSVLLQPPGRRDHPVLIEAGRPRVHPVAEILRRIGKLFG